MTAEVQTPEQVRVLAVATPESSTSSCVRRTSRCEARKATLSQSHQVDLYCTVLSRAASCTQHSWLTAQLQDQPHVRPSAAC